MSLQISKIQDDGKKFILHGSGELQAELERILDNIGMGVSVSESGKGTVNVLYTENNRDLVLKIIRDSVDGRIK